MINTFFFAVGVLVVLDAAAKPLGYGRPDIVDLRRKEVIAAFHHVHVVVSSLMRTCLLVQHGRALALDALP